MMNASFNRLNASMARLRSSETRRSSVMRRQMPTINLRQIDEAEDNMHNGTTDFADDSSQHSSRISFQATSDHSNYSDDDMESVEEQDPALNNMHLMNGMLNWDEQSFGTSGTSRTNKNNTLARRETTAINYFRSCLWLVFFVVTIAVSVLAYRVPKDREQERFEESFEEVSQYLQSALSVTIQQRLDIIQMFCRSIERSPSSATTASNGTSDYRTIQQLEQRGENLIKSTKLVNALLLPIVETPTELQDWETYSQFNSDWLQNELASSSSSSSSVSSFVYEVDLLNTIQAKSTIQHESSNVLLPIWQFVPVVDEPTLINYNALSDESYKVGVEQSLSQIKDDVNQIGFSQLWKPDSTLSTHRQQILNYVLPTYTAITNITYDSVEPVTDIYFGIYQQSSGDGNDDSASTAATTTTTSEKPQLSAIFASTLHWKSLLVNLISTKGIVVVITNSLEESVTYEMSSDSVRFIGYGDRHDTQFDNRVNTTTDRINVGMGTIAAKNDEDKNAISYHILVYPSSTFADLYCTNQPIYFGVSIFFAFVIFAVIFFGYTRMIERRQRIIMEEATASSAIVSSLFPKTVRDRLVEASATQTKQKNGPSINAIKNGGNGNDDNNNTSEPLSFMDAKLKPTDNSGNNSRPIADTFENTTVLFADIAGFTSWCAKHEPSDVFLLLETLYGEFDKIARKREVFKVETIGDCYVAVTGLPEPQEDHAIIMSLFAHECMRTMKLLMVKDLRELIGSDPTILSMRFGLHSGSVTAGVLRGEKSRFQLFGDTVNLAARIEHTGKRDRIHLSEATGQLLIEAGKQKWLVERSDCSPGLGKTYWLRPRAKTSDGKSRSSSNNSTTTGSVASLSDMFSVSSKTSLDNASSHSMAWPEASTHSPKGWGDQAETGDGFSMDETFSDSGDSFM